MIQRVIIGLMAGLVLAGTAVADDHTLAERLAAASPENGEKTFTPVNCVDIGDNFTFPPLSRGHRKDA
jgi:hypothetical protein